MKKHLGTRMIWRIFVISFVVASSCALATLLPAQSIRDLKEVPIRDFKHVAGKWEGKLSSTDGWDTPYAVIINEDGTGDGIVSQESPVFPYSDNGRFPIERKLVDGKISSRNKISGDTGIATLFEGGGKRVLEYMSNDGKIRASWEPTQK